MKKKFLILAAILIYIFSAFCTDLQDFYDEYKTNNDIAKFSAQIDDYIDSDYFKFLIKQNQEKDFTDTVLELQKYLHEQPFEEDVARINIQNLIIKSQSQTIKSMNKTEKLYQLLILAVSTLGIAFLLQLIFYINNRRKLNLLQLENEKENIASQTLINVQEAERKRIYQDLHDSVVQNIRVNQMNLRKLDEKTNETLSSENKKLLNQILDSEGQSLQEIKNIINNLTPPELNGTDFRLSITNLCQNLSEASDIPCSIFIEKELDFEKLSEVYKLHIYRIIQESITNAIKHAKASEISVIIKSTENTIVVFITDDGVGIESGFNHDTGLGLRGIKSRITYMNGTMKIISNPESGTELRLEIPY